jgi:hypothetical protein
MCATSAYTALVQLYVRSGQLLTAEGMVKKGQSGDNSCRIGHKAIEDMHHIFVNCPKYMKLKDEAIVEVTKKTNARIQSIELEETCTTSLLRIAKSLFINCYFTWPLHYTFYYLKHVLLLDLIIPINIFKTLIQHEHFIHNIKGDWHISSIKLASHIYGRLQKEMARRQEMMRNRKDYH